MTPGVDTAARSITTWLHRFPRCCNFSHSAVGISSHYVAVSPGSAWQAFEGQLCRKWTL